MSNNIIQQYIEIPDNLFVLLSRYRVVIPGIQRHYVQGAPDFVNASPTRNRPVHKPQRECNISTTSRIGYGGAILFISHRVTRIKIITADYQVVTSAS